jgi:predicted transcriptional regulator
VLAAVAEGRITGPALSDWLGLSSSRAAETLARLALAGMVKRTADHRGIPGKGGSFPAEWKLTRTGKKYLESR